MPSSDAQLLLITQNALVLNYDVAAPALVLESFLLNPARKKIIKAWIASGLWLALIAIESTTWLSSDETSRILYPILHFLTGVDPLRFAVWHFYIRKAGHFVGYFVLSLLLFWSWRATLPIASSLQWTLRWASIAFLMAALVASLDEWHQTFLPSRTGTLHDVLLDGSAALVAQILIFVWLRVRARPHATIAALGSD